MAKFAGNIGYGVNVEDAPGVWVEDILERPYFGDVIRNTRNLREGETLNHDITVSNSISVVADAYLQHHFFAIRYVKWAGALWTIDTVEVQSPRLILRLGSLYNGPVATPAGVYGTLQYNKARFG